jgi:pimeloyl-ACP methyl ester carboxylesterase
VERLVLADAAGAGGPHSLLRVLLGRGVDGVLEWQLTGRGWSHAAQNLLTHPRNFAYQTWLAAKTDLSRRAALVRAPTLIGWGALDHTFPPRAAMVLLRQMPRATLYVSKNGSHDWIVDRPTEFVAAVREFALGRAKVL